MYAKKIAHRPRIDRGCGDFQSEGSRYWDQSFVQFAVCIYIQKELRKGGGCIRRQTMRTLREQVPAATGARVGRGGVTRERNEKARGAFSRGKGFSQQYRKQMSTLRRTLQMVQKLTAHSAMCVLHALWLSGRGQCTDVEASTDERTTAARYDCGGIERCQTRICGPCGGDPATRRQQEVEFNETSLSRQAMRGNRASRVGNQISGCKILQGSHYTNIAGGVGEGSQRKEAKFTSILLWSSVTSLKRPSRGCGLQTDSVEHQLAQTRTHLGNVGVWGSGDSESGGKKMPAMTSA
ncbi:hypothetical protein DFH06DRAFT_1127947 [Mycena polygramma]|nr:hypothetical protein DFH06DRAFT_1127947 [Mycena polygramma]